MVEDLLFVSCDIQGHSVEPEVRIQLRHAAAINEIVRRGLESPGLEEPLWFSGGDGGHVALAGVGAPTAALQLLISLRKWSLDARVPLRIAACTGIGQRFSGADGRTDMVGPGLNLASRVLQHAGSDERIVVTDEFRARCLSAAHATDQFHEPRMLRGPFAVAQQVYLFSVRDQFESRWDSAFSIGSAAGPDDRTDLRDALTHKDGLSVLSRAKRLLQVNANDNEAIRALREHMGAEGGRIGPSRMLTQMFGDPALGQEFVRAAVLVERRPGEALFRAGDEGQTMFLILRGRLGGYLPGNAEDGAASPDFELGVGELLGEMAFALKTRRTATLVCIEECSLLAFSRQELFAAAAASPLLTHVKQAVDALVSARILQNICRTADYLSGERRAGPLGQCDRPWVELAPFSRTITVNWQERELDLDGQAFREPGIYVLAGGKLQLPDGSMLQPHVSEPPILAAELPGEVRYRPGRPRLLDDVTLLFVGRAGFDQFGPEVHDRLVAEIRARTGGTRRPDRKAAGVEGLLRIGENSDASSSIDVIFVHGLDGDARSTWHPKDQPLAFWPSWLAEDVAGVTVWSLGYEVNSSAWRGAAMPLSESRNKRAGHPRNGRAGLSTHHLRVS